MNKALGKCKDISEDSFRLEDLYTYESLRGKVNFVTKPSGVDSKLAWNSFLKIVIHAIYYVNKKDVRTHTFEALSTRPSKKRSSDASESGDKEPPVPDQQHHHHQEVLRDRDNLVDQDVFVDTSTIEAVQPEPAKKVARLSSHDMFGPDSPPVASTNILTPLFEIATNSGNTSPQTVRLQILEIVGVDKFGYIGRKAFNYSFLFTLVFF